MINELSQLISIPVMPIALFPVTGLLCLVFYNRSSSIHARIRAHQKELRELYLAEKDSQRIKEMIELLNSEIAHLKKRSRRIGFSLFCLLCSVILFSLCSFLIVVSLVYPPLLYAGIFFWLLGPLLICTGLVSGLFELIRSFTQSLDDE